MNTLHEKPVSQRKFATMVGKSEGGVRKAVGGGSISDGVEDGKILPSVASIEWGKAILDGWVLFDSGEWLFEKSETPEAIQEIETEIIQREDFGYVVIDVPTTLKSAEIKVLPEIDINQPEAEALVYTGDEDVINSAEDAAEFLKDIPEGTTKIEAERLYSVFRARKVKRELQKVEGELVDKGLVYKNLYEFAAIIRDKFMNLPDRVVDNVMAADTRNEAIRIITDEVTDVLQSLSGVGSIKLMTV